MDQDTTVRAVEALVMPPKPDSAPVMLNTTPPFRYPPSLYDRKVQGNVTLRLFIDSTGRVWPESTLVSESSGFPALDTAAIKGSDVLRFKPAIKNGAPMNVRVAFPVFFRHPEARPLPGDTVLRQPGTGTR
jgi:TonB family protein